MERRENDEMFAEQQNAASEAVIFECFSGSPSGFCWLIVTIILTSCKGTALQRNDKTSEGEIMNETGWPTTNNSYER